MSFVSGSNSAFNSSSFFFSSSSSRSRPSLVVDFVLTLLHAVNILLQADHLVSRLRSVIAHQLRDLGTVGGVLVHAQLEAFAELLIELFIIVLFLSDLRKHLKALLNEVLLDHAQNLVLLQRLTRDVQRQILGIHYTLHEIEPFGHQLVAVIHDEYAAHVQLDIVALLLGLEQVEGRTARHEEQSAELQLPFDAEMLYS